MPIRPSSSLAPVALALCCLFACASAGAAAPKYDVTDLGTFGGAESDATGINSAGMVSGYSNTAGADGHFRAFIYDGTQLVNLGTLSSKGDSYATGVDPKGHASGYATVSGGLKHAVEFTNGTLIDLNKKAKVFVQSQAMGINVHGWMVGTALLADGEYHAWIYGQGHFKTLDAGSRGAGLNNKGAAVGTVKNQGVIFNFGSADPIGTLGGSWSEADAVNDGNLVTGWSATDGDAQSHAFVWNNGNMTDLGTLGGTQSQGLAINVKSVVVGWSTTHGTKVKHAFVTSGKSLADLNDLIAPGSGWTLVAATAVNAAGEIAGVGTINGETHAFKLTPTTK